LFLKLESFTLHELKVTQINNLKVEKEKKKSALKPLEIGQMESLLMDPQEGLCLLEILKGEVSATDAYPPLQV
jgi:hypothetical protein